MQQAGPPFQQGAPAPYQTQQGGWSFTGPPPGLPMQPQPFHFYQAYPPMGMVGAPRPPPMMNMNIPPRPNMPPTHPPPSMHLSQPSQWMGKMLQPFPTNPAVLAAGPGAHPIEKKYANKKERDKAKKERKEARKLAENPLQPLTEDVEPRAFLNDGERQETLQWIEERKSRFPTRDRIANVAAQADTLNQAGGSKGQSGACDSRLFAVLQEQHKRGLLRSAGTEDLFRSFSAQGSGSGRGMGSKRGRGRGRGRGQGRDSGPPPDRDVANSDVATDRATVPDSQQVDFKLASLEQAGAEATEAQAAVAPTSLKQEDCGEKVVHDAGTSGTDKAAAHQPVAAHGHTVLDVVIAQPDSAQALIAGKEQELGKEDVAQAGNAKRKLGDTSAAGGQTGARKAAKGQGGWQRAEPQGKPGTHKPCLLHRLLASDVRQDRSLLLQALRFFVANDFLQRLDTTSLQFPDTAK